MFDPMSILSENIKTLKPYEPHCYNDVIKLDANENPYPLPKKVLDDIAKVLTNISFNRYPDSAALELRERIAGYAGVETRNILVGNGSDEIILNIMLAFGCDKEIVITEPTFSVYKIHAQIAKAKPVPVKRDENFNIDIQKLLKASKNAAIIVICSPNNPTGSVTSLKEVEFILQNTNALVVVDQAYLEFGGENCIPLVEKYPNLLVLRTFSKAFGIAALRVGYAVASAEIIKLLARVKQPYNLSAFSQVAARIALDHISEFKKQWQRIIDSKVKLFKELSKIQSIKVYPTDANYILFFVGNRAEFIHSELLKRKILIRNLGKDMPGYLRVSIGTEEENKAFLNSLTSILNERNV
ncbi:MAG: histidinol-phosphate transaminase [Desulfotomaculum sp.]|nr:histidinol-phosphate transaminase [Desulfotomaculum sp.]